MKTRALVQSAIIGTVLQVAMVVAGHSNQSIAALFAVGGMGISLVAGIIFVALAKTSSMREALTGGSAAGGICAFIGILVSYLLGDVPASLLALGTISSIVTGAVGGALGRALMRGRDVAAVG